MSGTLTARGNDPLPHLALLFRSPQRILGLRLALARVVNSESTVLDAGCGALGLLAIMAAKQGAARVVGVDVADLALARELAEENGVADRVSFIEGKLGEADVPDDRFDVLIGMIYRNDPKSDLPQQQIMKALIERHAHERSAILPNSVRYAVAGYTFTRSSLDRALNFGQRTFGRWGAGESVSASRSATRRADWEAQLFIAERSAGVSLGAVRSCLASSELPSMTTTLGAQASRPGRPARNSLGSLDRSRLELLTSSAVLAEIDYTKRPLTTGYPESLELPVTRAGVLNAVVWQQDLVFDDILIKTTETLGILPSAPSVAPGDRAVLETGSTWTDRLGVHVERGATRSGS